MAPPSMSRGRPVLTSLPLEISLFFGGCYDAVFWVLQVAIFIYKGFNFPYSKAQFGVEFTFVFLFALLEPLRLFLGSKGNKTEKVAPLAFSILLAAPTIVFFVYYLTLQAFVLRIDQVLTSIGIAFCGSQLLIGIFTMLSFWSASRGF